MSQLPNSEGSGAKFDGFNFQIRGVQVPNWEGSTSKLIPFWRFSFSLFSFLFPCLFRCLFKNQ